MGLGCRHHSSQYSSTNILLRYVWRWLLICDSKWPSWRTRPVTPCENGAIFRSIQLKAVWLGTLHGRTKNNVIHICTCKYFELIEHIKAQRAFKKDLWLKREEWTRPLHKIILDIYPIVCICAIIMHFLHFFEKSKDFDSTQAINLMWRHISPTPPPLSRIVSIWVLYLSKGLKQNWIYQLRLFSQ